MTDLASKTPRAAIPGRDFIVVHYRPADFDPNDPTRIGSGELVTLESLGIGSGGGGSGDIDGGTPGGSGGGSGDIDGGNP